eukprot:767742-Hanusia_phi.AAC.2
MKDGSCGAERVDVSRAMPCQTVRQDAMEEERVAVPHRVSHSMKSDVFKFSGSVRLCCGGSKVIHSCKREARVGEKQLQQG